MEYYTAIYIGYEESLIIFSNYIGKYHSKLRGKVIWNEYRVFLLSCIFKVYSCRTMTYNFYDIELFKITYKCLIIRNVLNLFKWNLFTSFVFTLKK